MKIDAHADRPCHRAGIERQRAFDLIEEFKWIAALAVDLVDEGDDRDVAEAADLEQLARLALDALGGIDFRRPSRPVMTARAA
jgi:hypothetical protein